MNTKKLKIHISFHPLTHSLTHSVAIYDDFPSSKHPNFYTKAKEIFLMLTSLPQHKNAQTCDLQPCFLKEDVSVCT
jgi:hypothetical protein